MAQWTLLKLFYLDPEEDVVALRQRAIEIITEGKTLMTVSAGGKSGQKQFPMDPAQVVFECNAALRDINPAKYGQRIRKTYHFSRNRWD